MTQRVAECGILTSKRQVSKSAVVRNRAKRRVRALFAALDLAALESQMARKDIKSIRILVVCQKECVAHPFEILKPKLLAGLEKLIEVVAQTLGEPV
jgi:ribonuclease P protein component